MANTVKLKMKCTGLQLAAGGVGQEVVELTEVYDRDITKNNVSRVNPPPGGRPMSTAHIVIDPESPGKGQFIKDMLYVCSFLETT